MSVSTTVSTPVEAWHVRTSKFLYQSDAIVRTLSTRNKSDPSVVATKDSDIVNPLVSFWSFRRRPFLYHFSEDFGLLNPLKQETARSVVCSGCAEGLI